MRKNDGRLVGILGTVIIHLIAGIIFMSFQIMSVHTNKSDEFVVEFTPVQEVESKDNLIELPATTVEKILQGDEDMLNIARNLASKSVEKINPSDYIDMVKEELIKSGKLGADNYIDEQKKLNEKKTDENPASEKLQVENKEPAKPDKSQEMASNYKGPTRIYYDLTGRTHRYLPIPIYKCQGSGKVTLSIEVDQRGIVGRAVIIADESTTSDPCLIETAVTTALISRFNSDINSPKTETGTLTYIFVSQ